MINRFVKTFDMTSSITGLILKPYKSTKDDYCGYSGSTTTIQVVNQLETEH